MYSIVKLCATKEDSNFLIQMYEMFFYVDYVKKITCKEAEIQKAICMFVSQLRSWFCNFKGTHETGD